MRRERTLGPLLLAALGGVTGCGTLLGLDDFTDQPGASATTGAGGAGGTSTSASTAASGGGGASATTGQGGTGGSTFCEAGTTMPCYSGPAGTEGVGLCAAGEATCLPDGSAYGACAGDVLPAAKDDCATQEDENCDGYQCGQALWSQMFHGTSLEIPADVATDAAGNIYLFGDFRGSVDFGGGPLITAGGFSDYDLYLVKFSPEGDHVWSRQFGDGTDGQYARKIAIDDSGRIVIAGGFFGTLDLGGGATVSTSSSNKDGFVAVLDAQGQGLWAKKFGTSSSDELERVAVDGNGDLFLAQTFFGNAADWGLGAMSAPSGSGFFLAKLSGADGSKKWLLAYDKAGAATLAIDPAGSAYVGGSSTGVDFGFGPLVSSGGSDGFVAKFASAGAFVSATRFQAQGPGDGALVVGVGTDSTANLHALVQITGTVDVLGPKAGPGFVLYKANSLGLSQWTWSTPDDVARFNVDAAGQLVLAHDDGTFMNLTRLDPTGALVWSNQFPCDLSVQHKGLAFGKDGAIVLAGHANGTIDFGNGPLTSVALYDAFLASFVP